MDVAINFNRFGPEMSDSTFTEDVILVRLIKLLDAEEGKEEMQHLP